VADHPGRPVRRRCQPLSWRAGRPPPTTPGCVAAAISALGAQTCATVRGQARSDESAGELTGLRYGGMA
jgi:hypothetical protein